jgi:hypothetical protein
MSESQSQEEKEKKKKTAMQIWKQDYEAMLSHKPVSLNNKREDRFVMLPPPQVDPSIMKEAREIIKDKERRIDLYTAKFRFLCG